MRLDARTVVDPVNDRVLGRLVTAKLAVGQLARRGIEVLSVEIREAKPELEVRYGQAVQQLVAALAAGVGIETNNGTRMGTVRFCGCHITWRLS